MTHTQYTQVTPTGLAANFSSKKKGKKRKTEARRYWVDIYNTENINFSTKNFIFGETIFLEKKKTQLVSRCGKPYGVSKIKNETIIWLAPNHHEIHAHRKCHLCVPMFMTVDFTKTKKWKQPTCPQVGEWLKKSWYPLLRNTTYPLQWWNPVPCNPVARSGNHFN